MAISKEKLILSRGFIVSVKFEYIVITHIKIFITHKKKFFFVKPFKYVNRILMTQDRLSLKHGPARFSKPKTCPGPTKNFCKKTA